MSIILDYSTMSDIWMGRIISWRHPRILALNPSLAATNSIPDVNITLVVASSDPREIERVLFTTLNVWTKDTTSMFNVTYKDTGVPHAFTDMPLTVLLSNVQKVVAEDNVQVQHVLPTYVHHMLDMSQCR